jgi:hypothetical protein
LVKAKGLSQLLFRPLRGWVTGQVEVEDATTIMGQAPETHKGLKTDARDVKEVDGNQLRDVILEQGARGLRGWFAAAHHGLADAGLADVDVEF